MSTADREERLRAMAQSEAKCQLEAQDFMGVLEVMADYDLDLEDEEAEYVFDLIRMATPTLPDRKLEDYI